MDTDAHIITVAIGQGQRKQAKLPYHNNIPYHTLTILVPGGGVVAGVHLVAGLSLVPRVGVVVVVVVPLLGPFIYIQSACCHLSQFIFTYPGLLFTRLLVDVESCFCSDPA